MILYDLNSCFNRAIFTSVKTVNPRKKDSKYITEQFIDHVLFRMVDEITYYHSVYYKEYGDIILCVDNKDKPYWRKEVFPEYKIGRKSVREESEVDFNELFKHYNLFVSLLTNFCSLRVISVPGAEADDVIGALCKKFAPFEKILILSPDKDFKQLHKLGDIKQYSSITNNWVVCDDFENWELEHVCLGDAADGVPKITDSTKFTSEFADFIQIDEFSFDDLPYETRKAKMDEFLELHPDSKVFDNPRIGLATLKKKVQEFGSLDKFLDSNPLYRKHYNRNKTLVLDTEVPQNIVTDILIQYNESLKVFNKEKITEYFMYYNQPTCIQMLEDTKNRSLKEVEFDARTIIFD